MTGASTAAIHCADTRCRRQPDATSKTRWHPAGRRNGADFYESEVDATVKAVTSIIEPLMIVVGGIILAMYLPMFKIYELIE